MERAGINKIFKEFIKTIGKIVVFFDIYGDVIYANDMAIEELGLDEEKYPNMESIIPSYMDEKISFYNFASEFEAEPFDMVMYHSNYFCFPAEVRFGVWEDYKYGFCVAQNQTVMERLKHELARAEQETKELRDVRNSFIANVTHELRTPLNGIKGHLAQLESLEQNTAKHEDIYRIMERCSLNMEKIINNILDYNKLQSGKFQLEEAEFSLSDCIQQVYETNEMKANEKGLNFTTQIDKDIPDRLFGDGMHLQQILNNLVSNAIKFTEKGFVKVKVVKVYQLRKKIELFFVVVDSGIGVSVEARNRIFDSFVQADSSITRKYGGTGLGLSITKDLLQMMGSSINLESETGIGSTFSFSLNLQTLEKEQPKVSVVKKEAVGIFKEIELERQMEELTYQVGSHENGIQLKNNMEKLIICIEIRNWEKAEHFAMTIKKLLSGGEDIWKRRVLRMEMAIRREDYDKAVKAYEELQADLKDLVAV